VIGREKEETKNMIPESMAAFAASHGESGAEWVGRLPDLIATYADRWNVEIDATMDGSGSAAWVGAGHRPDGTDVVLKLAWPHF
jgi:hypothetical protein